MRRFLQILLPLVILLLGGAVVWWIIASKEEPRRKPFRPSNPEVSVLAAMPQSYQTRLRSQGSVQARTESSLIPEVRGRIVRMSPNFREGAFFEEGDVLAWIDDRDYRAELVVAEAALAQAELGLAQEQARYDQAKRDWDRLNPDREANELTLREPQMRQARANAASAKARLEMAQLNLQRTEIRAPFAGRVLTKAVDVGQYVSSGNQIARIYAVETAEIRLPLAASQFAFLNLPSIYRGSDPRIEGGPKVVLRSSIGDKTYEWEGRVVRAEGSIDVKSRQLFVVAEVDDPYGAKVAGRPPLKVGAFVEAEIEGIVLQDVFVLPRKLYRENSYVLLVDETNHLKRTKVNVAWEDDEVIVVDQGLRAGEMLCLTDVPYALEGWQVVITEVGAGQDLARVDSPANQRPASAGRGEGGKPAQRAEGALAQFGERLPGDLRESLSRIAAGTLDAAAARAVFQSLEAWARENSEPLPERRRPQ